MGYWRMLRSLGRGAGTAVSEAASDVSQDLVEDCLSVRTGALYDRTSSEGSDVPVPAGDFASRIDTASLAPVTAHNPVEAEVFRLSSANGGVVYADPSGMVVVRPGDRSGAGRELVGLRFRGDDSLLFLLPVDSSSGAIHVENDLSPGHIVPFRVVELGTGRMHLHDLRTRMFLSVSPFPPGPNPVGASRPVASDWETFVASAPTIDVSALLASTHVTLLARLMSEPVSVGRVMDLIEREDPEIVALLGITMLRLLDDDALAGLEQTAAEDPAVRSILTTIFAGSLWIGSVDAAVQEWSVARHRTSRLTVDATFMSRVVADSRSDGLARLPMAMALQARRQIEPRHTVALAAVIHNDGVFLAEWIAYHRSVGIEHFFIYSTDGEDGSEPLLDALAEAGVITWIRQSGKHAAGWRGTANRHLLSCLPEALDYRWLMVLDIDEFLVLNNERHESLASFLQLREAGGANAIALSRHLFRPGLAKTRHPKPIIERFVHRYSPRSRHVKPVMATRDFMSSYPCEPVSSLGVTMVYHNAAGQLHHWPGRPYHPTEGDPIFEDAWIQSYSMRSLEEFIWGYNRSRSVLADHGADVAERSRSGIGLYELVKHVRCIAEDRLVEDPPAASRLSGLAAELAGLLADPAIARAVEAVETRYRRRVEILKAEVSEEVGRDPVLRAFAASWLSPAPQYVDF